MKTIGYGLIQIPVVTRYRVCCIKRTLAGGVTSTGWQQILGCALRILLLSSWGLQSIDYTLPQTAEKLIGIYIEFGILTLLFANGVVVLIALWSNNFYLLYPSLILIPVCFLTDVIVKGTCYAALFLTPEVTSFGVLSLIEVWFRGLSLMYGWIIIISYIYYKRKDWKLTEVDVQLNTSSPDRVSNLVRRTSSKTKSPFSRHSSLSQRGRRSFLLKHNPHNAETNGTVKAEHQNVVDSAPKISDTGDDVESSLRDGESDVLLGESATMSLSRTPGPRGQGSAPRSPVWSDSIGGNSGMKRYLPSSLQRSPPRYKKRGGFVPEVLRTSSKLTEEDKPAHLQSKDLSPQSSYTESAMSGNTIEMPTATHKQSEEVPLLSETKPNSSKKEAQTLVKMSMPPSLPERPPVGPATSTDKHNTQGSLMSWFKKTKEKPAEESSLSLNAKHVPEPVLV